MRHLALDIWDDLREKRLWPVAAVLLVAMIAIPLFVMKPAAETASVGAPPAAPQAQGTPAVAVVDESSREGSKLGVFGRKDPFRPPAAALESSVSSGTAGSASAAGARAASPVSPGPSAGSGAPSGSSGGSGPTGGRSLLTPPPVPKPRRTAYTYVIDIDFGRDGHLGRRRGVPRLTVLPNERSPLTVFLGVSASGKSAVFLLNTALKQGGEGTCRPSRATCTFLHLSTDPAKNEHRIVDGKGVSYLLRLKMIRRVTVREATRASRASRARAGASARVLNLPVFADDQR